MIARAPTEAFSERLPHYKQRVTARLERILAEDGSVPAQLLAAMRYAVLGSGKRVRPLLVYASGELCGTDDSELDAMAAAVELIHAYSLVHDDLPAMDDDDLRRGKPSTHRAFDEATAILAGDALQTLAFEVLCNDPALARNPAAQVRVLGRLARAAGAVGMVGGQALDCEAEGRSIDETLLEDIHRRKTGDLIRAAIMMPAECGELEGDEYNALDHFARDIGLVFQIRDDLLEVEEDTATLGKNAGSDSANGKSTYPAIIGLDAARRRADKIHAGALDALASLGPRNEALYWLSDFILKRTS